MRNKAFYEQDQYPADSHNPTILICPDKHTVLNGEQVRIREKIYHTVDDRITILASIYNSNGTLIKEYFEVF